MRTELTNPYAEYLRFVQLKLQRRQEQTFVTWGPAQSFKGLSKRSLSGCIFNKASPCKYVYFHCAEKESFDFTKIGFMLDFLIIYCEAGCEL